MSFEPFGDDPARYVRYYNPSRARTDCHNNPKNERGWPVDVVSQEPIKEPYYKGILPTEKDFDPASPHLGMGKCYNKGTLETWMSMGKNTDPESRAFIRLDKDARMHDLVKRHLKLVKRLKESNRMLSEGTLDGYPSDAWDKDGEGEKVMMDLIAVLADPDEWDFTRKEALRYLMELCTLETLWMPTDLIAIYSAEKYDNTIEASAAMTVLRGISDLFTIGDVIGGQITGRDEMARARAFVNSALENS